MKKYFNKLQLNSEKFRRISSIIHYFKPLKNTSIYSIIPNINIDFSNENYHIIQDQYYLLNKHELSQDYFFHIFKKSLWNKNKQVAELILNNMEESQISFALRECITSHRGDIAFYLLESPKYSQIIANTPLCVTPEGIRQENDFLYFSALYNNLEITDKLLEFPSIAYYLTVPSCIKALLANCITYNFKDIAKLLLQQDIDLSKTIIYMDTKEKEWNNASLEQKKDMAYYPDHEIVRLIKKRIFYNNLSNDVPIKEQIKSPQRKTKI